MEDVQQPALTEIDETTTTLFDTQQKIDQHPLAVPQTRDGERIQDSIYTVDRVDGRIIQEEIITDMMTEDTSARPRDRRGETSQR
jgi:hypothetical protein